MGDSDSRHTDDRYADLADVILALARAITTDAHADGGVVALTPTQINVMRFVDRNPGTSPSSVAAATGLHRSNLSRVLRELEAEGLVERTVDATDGRGARLMPTARAGRNLERLRANWTRLLSETGVDDRHLTTALRLLTELEDALAPAPQPGI